MSGPLAKSNALPVMAAAKGAAHASPLELEVVSLFDQWREPILRYLLGFSLPPADGEEVVQETFLALFQHLRKGRPQANLRGWLFRVAHNLALKKIQRSRRDAHSFADWAASAEETLVDPGPGPEDEFSQAQTRKRLQSVLRALPEQDRRCLHLRAEGLRYREIAEVLDMSLGAVAISLERSLARLTRASER